MARTIIVVPCFNEGERLPADRFRAHATLKPDRQFLFVNDGSTDDTAVVLNRLQDEDPAAFQWMGWERNAGKAEAVRNGVLRAFGEAPEFVGYWDADLATPLEAIDDLLQVLAANSSVELAMGSRVKLLGRKIERRAVRHYLGRVFATAASGVLGISVYDTQCGAKLFRPTDAIRTAFEKPFLSKWIFDVEFLARYLDAVEAGGHVNPEAKIREVPLNVWSDVSGSKIRLRDVVQSAVDLIQIHRAYRRERRSRRQEPF